MEEKSAPRLEKSETVMVYLTFFNCQSILDPITTALVVLYDYNQIKVTLNSLSVSKGVFSLSVIHPGSQKLM